MWRNGSICATTNAPTTNTAAAASPSSNGVTMGRRRVPEWGT